MNGGYLALGREATAVESFDFVFSVHRDFVYGLTRALLGNAQDAEDVTQDVFLRVYKALPSYQSERATMRTWLTTMTVNACNTHRRRNFLHNVRRQAANYPVSAHLDKRIWRTHGLRDDCLVHEVCRSFRLRCPMNGGRNQRFGFTRNLSSLEFRYGYKAHVGVDEGSGLIRAVITTAANVNDTTPADDLILGTVDGEHGA